MNLEIIEKMDSIHEKTQLLERLIEEDRQAIHAKVSQFKNYWEAYTTLKQTSINQEEFNIRMGRIRVSFLNSKRNASS